MNNPFTLSEFIDANYIKDNNTGKIYKKILKTNYENNGSVCYDRDYIIIDINKLNNDFFNKGNNKEIIISKTKYKDYIAEIIRIRGNEKPEILNKYSIVDKDELDFIISIDSVEMIILNKKKKKEIVKKDYIFE